MGKNIDFHSTTKKIPHRIKGENSKLYYFLEYCGVTKNGFDREMTALAALTQQKFGGQEYLDSQEDAKITLKMLQELRDDPMRNEEFAAMLEEYRRAIDTRKISENPIIKYKYAYSIYKKEDDLSYEDFVKLVKGNKIPMVHKLMFSTNNKLDSVDDNGNLVLKTVDADLDKVIPECGDVLLSGEGEVLSDTKGSMCIFACDEFGNYPVTVFSSGPDGKSTGECKYNYLDKKGHLYTRKHFSRSEIPTLYEIENRTYSDEGFEEKNYMYPTAYVITDRQGVKLYPSATALLIAHRSAIQENPEAGIVGDDKEFVVEYYKRFAEIEDARKKLQYKFNYEVVSEDVFKKAMRTLDDELRFMQIFAEDFETPADRKLADELLNVDDVDFFVDVL